MKIPVPLDWECLDDQMAVPFARAWRPGMVLGADLRGRIDLAVRSAGGSTDASVDEVRFLGHRNGVREWAPRGRHSAGSIQEHVRRLCGAITAAAAANIPAWLRRDITGASGLRHCAYESRRLESRMPALAAWRALSRCGYSAERLARHVRHVRRVAWVRWGIDVPRRLAVECLGENGPKRAVFVAVAALANRTPGRRASAWQGGIIAASRPGPEWAAVVRRARRTDEERREVALWVSAIRSVEWADEYAAAKAA